MDRLMEAVFELKMGNLDPVISLNALEAVAPFKNPVRFTEKMYDLMLIWEPLFFKRIYQTDALEHPRYSGSSNHKDLRFFLI
ncbi:MAG: hypothetical protein JRL30_11245 [Deltaproteobacteria bacterium]|nr:hypothetical protein [Deltaproteobacteria bacterium]